jgi:hypothetical protein
MSQVCLDSRIHCLVVDSSVLFTVKQNQKQNTMYANYIFK